MATTVKIEGLRELDQALGDLTKGMAKSTLQRVLKKAADPILREAKSRVPQRDPGAPPSYWGKGERRKLRRPGTADALVHSSTRLTRNQARQARKAGKSFAEHYVGTRDPISRLIEFGTADTPAQPFMRPAWEIGKGQALEIARTELGEEIKKSTERASRRAAIIAAKG